MQDLQDVFLDKQSCCFAPKICPSCGCKLRNDGNNWAKFHSVYTDHKLKLPRVSCRNPDCRHGKFNTSLHSLFGSNIHPDLAKKQAECASEMSFIKAKEALARDSGKYRKINNQVTIKNTTDKIGSILSDLNQKIPDLCSELPEGSSADHLIAQVDGGYVKSFDKNNRSFEVLVSNVYKIEDHKSGGITKNGKRASGTIENKIYSASTIKDRGKTIKSMIMVAAKKQGMTNKTKITGLSDGASNCWSTIQSLNKYCASIECILDWHHISMKFDKIINQSDALHRNKYISLKWKLWHGKHKEAIEGLGKLYVDQLETDYSDRINELLKYLSNNSDYLVNYQARKNAKLPYTSSIIESTIETLVNTRHKKKHKAQWSREGAHNLLQIRAARASNHWNQNWSNVKDKFYVPKSKAA